MLVKVNCHNFYWNGVKYWRGQQFEFEGDLEQYAGRITHEDQGRSGGGRGQAAGEADARLQPGSGSSEGAPVKRRRGRPRKKAGGNNPDGAVAHVGAEVGGEPLGQRGDA